MGLTELFSKLLTSYTGNNWNGKNEWSVAMVMQFDYQLHKTISRLAKSEALELVHLDLLGPGILFI